MDIARHWPDRRPRLEVLRCPACGELHLSRDEGCVLECDARMEEVYVSRADDEVQGAVDQLSEVIAWARKADVPLMSPPRVPEAAQAMSDEVVRLRSQLEGVVEALEYARLMAHSPGRDPANVLRDVRGALGLDRNAPDPAGGQ